ncbi:DMT family transporter [Roseibium denhamense]|uniref:EamA-like transporter family protein n=1 Tax=Roseibium denhamense TaxID=76305 RepID=A0ABY1PB40_9HYPH|nr:DMT family transporter [Roseibium denhamense]MTI04534.1 DMT family transporter [Roseibium denhamense]SMP28323.1 EamA-like transporter family protein [Roseibium denhamense]
MSALAKTAPAIFVLLWSTGFVGSKLGAPYIDPMVFLTIRFLAVLPVMLVLGLFLARSWPKSAVAIIHCIVTGMLVHGLYLGGVFWAIKQGMPAGASSIIVGLQPVLTALIAVLILREKISGRHWLSMAIGIAGLMLVLGPRMDLSGAGITPVTIAAVVGAVLAISLGTVYQKRFVPSTDLIAATLWQYVGALFVTLPLSLFESWQISWTGDLIFAMAWLVLVLSIGAVLLLMLLIRQGAVSSVASLFYLVPVATVIESYFLFGETLSIVQVAGMTLVVGAVLTIRSKPKAA